jgi:predicted enzyme related to lactoylglutathione lyase
MSLRVDHVTIAGSHLAPLEQAFTGAELKPVYGGPHSNGITHMALLSFSDGSYIELISTLEPGQTSPLWHAHIAGDGGPCAWAVEVDDVAAEAARLAALGVPVVGPTYLNRQRPDGVLVEWDLAFLGGDGPGATLPFIIKDRTPREWRVPPSTRVAEAGLRGVAMAVLGVEHLDRAVDLFRQVYGWPVPQVDKDTDLGARLAHFPGTPVTLAATVQKSGWLAERLVQYGESPCAFLLGTEDVDAMARRFPLARSGAWFGRRVRWFDPARLKGIRLGLVAEEAEGP